MSSDLAHSPVQPSSNGHDKRRWIVLAVVCMAMLMNALDSSIVNVALPSIQRNLHFSQANLTWVIDAYMITFGSLLLFAGRLGDLIGRKRVFLSGVLIFTLASGVCAAARNPATLISARFVQGAGGAISSAAIFAIIVTEFPTGLERAKAMSYYILVAVGGSSAGLLAGGILTQSISWHWIFLINIPIGLVTLALGFWLIEENQGISQSRDIDVVGSVLITVALMIGIYAIIEASSYGWLSTRTLVVGALALALGVVFFAVEARLQFPIMPLRVLRQRTLVYSSIVRGFAVIGIASSSFLGALDLERVQGYGPLHTGEAFLPMTLVTAVLSCGLTARLVHRLGPFRILLFGLAALTAGLVLLAIAGHHADYWTLLFPAFSLVGLGGGTAFLPLLTIAMVDIPPADAGLGSGIVNVSMQVSSAVGLAVLGTLAASRSVTLGRSGSELSNALLGGYQLAFWVSAGIVAMGWATAFVLLREPGRRVVQMSAHTDESDLLEVHELVPAAGTEI